MENRIKDEKIKNHLLYIHFYENEDVLYIPNSNPLFSSQIISNMGNLLIVLYLFFKFLMLVCLF